MVNGISINIGLGIGNRRTRRGDNIAPTVYDPDAQILFDAWSQDPGDSVKRPISNMIRDIKGIGVWAKLDAFYILLSHDANDSLINAKSPGTYDCTPVNGPHFILRQGWHGDINTAGHLDTGFTPSTAAGNWTLNSACMFTRTYLTIREDGGDMGAFVGGNANTYLFTTDSYNNASFVINSDTASFPSPFTDLNSLFIVNRPDGATQELYKDGVLALSDPVAAGALTTSPIHICQTFNSNATTTVRTQSVAGFGAGLTAEEAEQLSSIINNFVLTNLVAEYHPNTEPYLRYMLNPATGQWKEEVNTLVTNMSDTGIFDKLDLFYIFASQTDYDAMLNVIKPGWYRGNPDFNGGAYSWTQYVGWNFEGTSNIRTIFQAGEFAPQMSQDSACMGGWNYYDAIGTNSSIGSYEADTELLINIDPVNITWNANVDTPSINSPVPASVKGLWAVNRGNPDPIGFPGGVAQGTLYINGISNASTNTPTSAINGDFFTFGTDGVANSNNTMSFAFLGSSLTATEHLIMYNLMRNFLINMGSDTP